jgi:nicotinate-nucleotide pyrophosphorylase (carboxylating)
MNRNNPILERLIDLALEEDLGPGDLTTDSVVDRGTDGKAQLITREKIILAGLNVFKMVFTKVDPRISFEDLFREGEKVSAGEIICHISGPLNSILKSERTALNFMQRMSGISTMTGKYVERISGSNARILDTRKTVPLLRSLDKYAVRTGGGFNHRFGLFDGILIKDNHISVAGSISGAVEMARRNAPHLIKVEVEVEDIEGARDALNAGADAVLLDNMTYEEMKKAVKFLKGKVLVEASGGITLENVKEVAETGVDFISVGALTHSPSAADLSLEMAKD